MSTATDKTRRYLKKRGAPSPKWNISYSLKQSPKPVLIKGRLQHLHRDYKDKILPVVVAALWFSHSKLDKIDIRLLVWAAATFFHIPISYIYIYIISILSSSPLLHHILLIIIWTKNIIHNKKQYLGAQFYKGDLSFIYKNINKSI